MGEGRILRGAIADLAPALGGDFAPIARLIATSRSPSDAIARIEAFCVEFAPARSAKIVEEVSLAFAANGALAFISLSRPGP